MNFVQISRASDNHPQKNACVFKISVFSVRSVVEIKPRTGDTTKLYVPPRWGSIGIVGLFYRGSHPGL